MFYCFGRAVYYCGRTQIVLFFGVQCVFWARSVLFWARSVLFWVRGQQKKRSKASLPIADRGGLRNGTIGVVWRWCPISRCHCRLHTFHMGISRLYSDCLRRKLAPWPEPSKPLANPPVAKPTGCSSPPRLRAGEPPRYRSGTVSQRDPSLPKLH